jgi:hypothetical protein
LNSRLIKLELPYLKDLLKAAKEYQEREKKLEKERAKKAKAEKKKKKTSSKKK